MSTVLDQILDQVKQVVRGVNGTWNGKSYALRVVPDEPGESIGVDDAFALVYPGSGSSGLKSSMGSNGYGNRWESETVIIDVLKPRSNSAQDLVDVRPYQWLIPNALFAAFARDRFNRTVLMLGDMATAGGAGRGSVATPVCRWQLIYPNPSEAGPSYIGWQIELDVTYEEDIVP